MAFSQLEINKFSAEGELLRKIRCLAGRITVFRSSNEEELEKFKKAVEGKSQPDRFSVLLDNSAFHPAKHLYIGCGPLDEAPAKSTVAEYLTARDLSNDAVEATLSRFGLGGLSQATCTELTPTQWKMLRMTALTCLKEISAIVIMYEPFETIPEQYRDTFADTLAKTAWEKNAIFVVTKLSYRPSVWIENDYIARVQLERPRQGTIGFGGGDLSAADTIANIRKELGITAASQQGGKAGIDLLSAPQKPFLQRLIRYLNSPKTLGILLSVVAILGGTLYVMVHEYEPVQVAQPGNVAGLQGDSTQSGDSFPGTNLSNNAGSQRQKNHSLPARKVVDGYPAEMQQAWLTAIDDPNSLFKTVSTTMKKAETVGNGTASDESLIQQLYKTLTQ